MSHSCSVKRWHRQALTLLELVVVLGILAVLSTVAVRSLEPIADQARYEITQNLLNDLRLATMGTDQHKSSFLYDTGALPGDADALLVRPSSLIPYAMQTFDSDRDTVNDVTLSSGWNGPYLQLGAGVNEVLDGWAATPTLVSNAGDLEIISLGSDGDSLSPEDGYRADLTVTIQTREYLGTVVFRLFAIDGMSGLRIDPNPVGTEQLGVLFYGVNAAGGADGSIAEQMLIVPNSGTFEYRRSNTLCNTVAARAIQWDDADNDDILDVGESIVKRSYVHYRQVHPTVDTRVEMELR